MSREHDIDLVREPAKTGAKHDADLRRKISALTHSVQSKFIIS